MTNQALRWGLNQTDLIQKNRRPVDCTKVIAAIAKSRHEWNRWSPGHRAQARWDIESALEVECDHIRNDFVRVAGKFKCLHMYDLNDHPEEIFKLPREAKAIGALNALRHASVSRTLIERMIETVRSRMEGTPRDVDINIAEATKRDIAASWKVRRRAWAEFIRRLRDYQQEVAR